MSENFYSGFEAILKTYERKLKECPKGVRLHQKINKNKNGKRNFYLSLQFKDPGTDKRSPKSCGEDFTEDGIIRAVEKAKLVDAKLRESNLSVSDFWEWYEAEIKQKCKFEDDRITYREIFVDMKRKYYAGKHKFSKIPRREGSDSFDASYEKCYLKYFNKFPNWDKYPEYDDFLKVIDHWPSGTYTHNAAISKCKDIAKYISNNDKIIKKLDSLYTVKTVYRKSESCSIEDYLLWYKEVKLSIPNLPKKQGDARDKTLWATAMMVAYGLRPHELTAIENLDKPVVKNETIIPALSDINNTDYLLVIGDVGYDGTTTKTGSRVTIPLIKDLELLEFLNLRMPKLHIYKPQQESLASSKIRGFGFNLAKNLTYSRRCPYGKTRDSSVWETLTAV